jgi:hypothetical protein
MLEKKKMRVMCHHFFLWSCCNKEAMAINYCGLLFSILEEEDNGVTTHYRLLLWWCSNEKGKNNLLPLPSSLVVLRFNLMVFWCL